MKDPFRTGVKLAAVRIISILVGAILVSSVLIGNFSAGTLSWFSNKTITELAVSAAGEKDFIESIELVYANSNDKNKEENPIALKLKKADMLKGEPIMYFSVDGEGAGYILHMNPIKLVNIENNAKDKNEFIAPIVPNINLTQWLGLICRKEEIKAEIRVKYLNEFINTKVDVKFTKEYLMSKFIQEIKVKSMNSLRVEDKGEDESKSFITELMIYLAAQTDWQAFGSTVQNSTDAKAKSFARTAAVGSESLGNGSVSISELALSEEQEKLIDAIIPGLRDYVSSLIENVKDLTGLLNEKDIAISEMQQQASLNQQQIDYLQSENVGLGAQLSILQDQDQELNTRVESLQLENDSLNTQNQSIQDDNEKLNWEIENLEEEKSELSDKVEELQALIDDMALHESSTDKKSSTPPSNPDTGDDTQSTPPSSPGSGDDTTATPTSTESSGEGTNN